MVRAFEGDKDATDTLQNSITYPTNIATLAEIKRGHMAEVYGLSLSDVFVDDRYGYVGGVTGSLSTIPQRETKRTKQKK